MQDTSEGFVREQAAKAAGTAAMDNDAIYAAILPLLRHEDHNVRRTALIAVKKRLHSDRVVFAAQEALEGRVKEFDRELEGIAAVRQMFQDVNGRCRFAAVDAFAKLIGQFHFEAVESAHSVLEDDEEWVRRFAADLLGKALVSCQRFYSTLSEMAIPNVKEGFNELIAAGIHCYEVGLTLRGGGDAYMRRIAVQGLCVVASSEESLHFDAAEGAEEDDDEGVPIFSSGKPEKIYFTAKDAIKILWKALSDDVNEIRKLASDTLLSLAAQGVPTAIDAVMWNVDTVITDGIDMPGLGNDGTPEYALWCETLGDASKEYEALMANVKSAQESHKLHLAKTAEEERRKRNALDVQLVHDAAEEGDWHYCSDLAFPTGEHLEEVLASEERDPDRKAIRHAAADCLQAIAASGHAEAAKAISLNCDAFFELTANQALATQAAEHVAEVRRTDEALLPKPRPVLLSSAQAKELEKQLLQVGDRNGRVQAAASLSKMAELGGASVQPEPFSSSESSATLWWPGTSCGSEHLAARCKGPISCNSRHMPALFAACAWPSLIMGTGLILSHAREQTRQQRRWS